MFLSAELPRVQTLDYLENHGLVENPNSVPNHFVEGFTWLLVLKLYDPIYGLASASDRPTHFLRSTMKSWSDNRL